MQNLKGEAEIRVRVKRRPRHFFKKLVLLILTAYVVIIAYGFIRDLIIASLVRIEPLQQGVIQSTVPATGILVRSEKTVFSPRSGTIKLIIPEGERVRVGEVVAQVTVASLENSNGEKTYNMTAPRSGVVSYHLDGLEAVYSYKNLKELDLNKVETLKPEALDIKTNTHIEEGKPVFKLINNLDPVYIIAKLDVNRLPAEEESFLITPDDGEKLYRAAIMEKVFFGKVDRILLKVSNYDTGFLRPRNYNFDVVIQRYEGTIIPVRAIVKKDGKDGIYIVFKERVKWKEIEIEGQAGDKAVITGVTPETKIITSPEYVKEGYPLTT